MILKQEDFKFKYELDKAHFELDKLQNEFLNLYLREDARFRRAYNTDFTKSFIEFIKDKVRLREPLHLSVTGTVRGGKTYSSIYLTLLINFLYGRIIDIKYICANSFEFLESIKQFDFKDTNNSCFQIDEEKNVFGIGSLAKKTKLVDVQNIIAKQNISTISICPTKVSNEDAFYNLRVFGREFNQKINRFMLYNLQGSERGEPLGMVYLPVFTMLPKEFSVPFEKDYIDKKDNWIAKEVRGEGDILYDIKRKTAILFSKDPIFKQIKKKDEKMVYIAQKLGSEWAKGEITEILNLTNLYINGMLEE